MVLQIHKIMWVDPRYAAWLPLLLFLLLPFSPPLSATEGVDCSERLEHWVSPIEANRIGQLIANHLERHATFRPLKPFEGSSIKMRVLDYRAPSLTDGSPSKLFLEIELYYDGHHPKYRAYSKMIFRTRGQVTLYRSSQSGPWQMQPAFQTDLHSTSPPMPPMEWLEMACHTSW